MAWQYGHPVNDGDSKLTGEVSGAKSSGVCRGLVVWLSGDM